MNQILGITVKGFRVPRFAALALAAALLLLFSASAARAGCAIPYRAAATPTPHPTAIPFVSPHPDDDWREEGSIVGLWHVLYTGHSDDNFPPGGPFPTIPFTFNESFKTWHADGTEFENAFLPPAGGNICYGVWKDLGDHRVKLHHLGLIFAADGSMSSIFTDDETITVASDGKTYKGTFTFRLWPPSYEAVGVGTPISEVKGSVAATRITVD